MIGVSLQYRGLKGEEDLPFRNPDSFLTTLFEKGVRSIELRSIGGNEDREKVHEITKYIWSHNMTVTVHGHVHGEETAVEDVIGPLRGILSDLRQKEVIVTVHPTPYDNVKILKTLSDYIIDNNLPIRIALENNRFMPDNSRGDCIGFVLGIVKAVDRQNIGICFDMGHYYYNCLIDSPNDTEILPPKDFLRRVIHTHIHALSPEKSTHFPFIEGNTLPLRRYLDALSHGYFGVYNIEIEHRRFASLYEGEEAWLKSVEAVNDTMPFCGRFYDDIRDNFKEKMKKSAEIFTEEKDGFSLVHSSSYLVKANKTSFSVDFALRTAGMLTDSYKELKDLLSDIKFMLITHEHIDHFDYEVVKQLRDTDIKWVIPDFLTETALKYGIKNENLITATANEKIEICGFEIMPFEGKHFRKTNGQGIRALGYFVRAKKSPSMLFLSDVRDYTVGNISTDGRPDYLFAHVWLGDNVAGSDTLTGELAMEFVRYMASFRPKNIVLAHLYESGRSRNNMWKRCHAEALSELFSEKYGDITVHIPLHGDTVYF